MGVLPAHCTERISFEGVYASIILNHNMGKQGRPPGSKDSQQRSRMKKTTAPKIQFHSNVRLTSASASEIASRSAFIANMRATESSESMGADATQDNNGTLRTMELEDEDSVGLICPLDNVKNHEHIMNQQECLSENIDAKLDDDNDVDIIDTTSGTMAVFLKAVHRQLREEVRGRVAKEQWLLTILKAPGADWWIRAGQA